MPREVIAQWTALDEADAGVIVLAFGDFEELLSLEFAVNAVELLPYYCLAFKVINGGKIWT